MYVHTYVCTYVRMCVRPYVQQPNHICACSDYQKWLQEEASKEGDDLKNENLKFAINFFQLESVPAYELFRQGVKETSALKYRAGRKGCAMLMLKLNSSKYLPLVLRDVATIDYLCTGPVQEERRRFMSCDGLGFGWRLEQSNRLPKRLVRGSC